MGRILILLVAVSVTTAANIPETLSKINAPECGLPHPGNTAARSLVVSRIFNGANTNQGRFPWMAYIYTKEKGQVDGYLCGGTLISKEYIITAAHCIAQPDSPELYRIVLGEHKASSRSGLEQDLRVTEIVVHEDYHAETRLNDIALIRLENPVVFSSYIRPVCLPGQGFPTDANENTFHAGEHTSYAGRLCTVLGWSETETKWKSDVLQQHKVTILPRLLCTPITSQMDQYISIVEEDEGRFCAGGVMGEDSCNVNGGGPLLCQDKDGRYHMHGITSSGPEPCGQPLLPGVFTEVSRYRDWMDANMQ